MLYSYSIHSTMSRCWCLLFFAVAFAAADPSPCNVTIAAGDSLYAASERLAGVRHTSASDYVVCLGAGRHPLHGGPLRLDSRGRVVPLG